MYYCLSFLGETQAQGCVGGGGSSKANGNSVLVEKKQETGNAMKARSSPCLKSPLLWSWEPHSSAPGQLQFIVGLGCFLLTHLHFLCIKQRDVVESCCSPFP